MQFDNNGSYLLEKKEIVYLVATIAAVITALIYDMYARKRQA